MGERRKERSDKKRQVKALISLETNEMIFRLRNITNTPIKDICEFLTVFVMRDASAINDISKRFKRSVWIDETYYNGLLTVEPIPKRLKVPTDLVSITFKAPDYERIATLAYALDITPSRTTAVLIEYASADIRAVNEYVYQNLKTELSEWQLDELRKVLTYVNRHNDHSSSWLSLLSKIVGDVRPATKKLYELVQEFLNK